VYYELYIKCLLMSGLSQDDFDALLLSCIANIRNRGDKEKAYWKTEHDIILSYTHEQAIAELIKSKKIEEKVRQIDIYIRGISRD